MSSKKFNRMSVKKSAMWLIPGIHLKRWLIMTILGVSLIAIGALILLEYHPINFSIQIIRDFAALSSPDINGSIAILLGLLLFLMGLKKANSSIIDAVLPEKQDQVVEALYRKHKLGRGPKIVAIGGGTGLSTILKGLKNITNNITAVVTVGDDGGSSGRLREEMGVLPPGDIRNCIAALADQEELVTELFQYRFNKGNGLEGHSFGNLFLSALCAITGDMVSAVKESSKVLAIRGKVLPSTLEDMRLVAEFEDGRIVSGESNIPKIHGKISRMSTYPKNLKALPEVIEAIKEADIIIMGPGSLYTSVIPNFLIPEIAKTVAESKAKKLYICNVMTQPGETDNYAVSHHIKAIFDHAESQNIIDTVFVNEPISGRINDKYAEEGSFPVKVDCKRVKELGVNIFCKKLIAQDKDGNIRHNPQRIARYIRHWYRTGGLSMENLENGIDIHDKTLEYCEDCDCESQTMLSEPRTKVGS